MGEPRALGCLSVAARALRSWACILAQWAAPACTVASGPASAAGERGHGRLTAARAPPRSFLPGYAVGRASPYGEGALALLRSLAQCGGLDAKAYARLVASTFGEGFEGYRNASITVRPCKRGMRAWRVSAYTVRCAGSSSRPAACRRRAPAAGGCEARRLRQ